METRFLGNNSCKGILMKQETSQVRNRYVWWRGSNNSLFPFELADSNPLIIINNNKTVRLTCNASRVGWLWSRIMNIEFRKNHNNRKTKLMYVDCGDIQMKLSSDRIIILKCVMLQKVWDILNHSNHRKKVVCIGGTEVDFQLPRKRFPVPCVSPKIRSRLVSGRAYGHQNLLKIPGIDSCQKMR